MADRLSEKTFAEFYGSEVKASCSSTSKITQLNGGSKFDIDSFQRQVIYTCSTSLLVE